MAVRPILTLENALLRQKSKRIKHFDKSLDPIIQDMIDTMRAAHGAGLAAPQIGIPLRLMVMEMQGEWEPEEGCLSVPGYWAQVKRAWAVTLKAKNRHGRDVRLKGEGFFGQALQHEVDHLDGILYVDRLDSLDQLRRLEGGKRIRGEGELEPAGVS